MLATSSCGTPAAEPEPRPARRTSSGEISEEVIRATLRAFAAEKRKAREHCEQGNRYFARAEFEKALREYREALKLSPGDPEYKRAVAKAELALGRR